MYTEAVPRGNAHIDDPLLKETLLPVGDYLIGSVEFLDLFFGVRETGAEHEIEGRIHVKHFLADVEDGDFASAARRSPVDAQFRFQRHFYPLCGIICGYKINFANVLS